MLWKTRLVFDDQFCFLFAYIHTFEGVSKCGLICFDVQANLLKDDDWIVHLDEETILTEGSVVGIVNFINEGKHQFGQGRITYANLEVMEIEVVDIIIHSFIYIFFNHFKGRKLFSHIV